MSFKMCALMLLHKEKGFLTKLFVLILSGQFLRQLYSTVVDLNNLERSVRTAAICYSCPI